jgi:WD40 repeat protein
VRALGRFQLVAVLGRGGFGTVYKAWDPAASRHVALKVPRKGAFTEREEIERFFREARLAIDLHHEAIVPCYELGEADGMPYLASEFIEGCTLADLLRARRPSFEFAADLLASVADALHHAHTRGIVHRDVKPPNIMLRNGRVPLVTDFGLAVRESGEPSLTRHGVLCGTPAYMSPEQAKYESHDLTPETDIYSAGVVLYEMLTGERPFVGNARMILKQILDDEPRPPRRLNDRVPIDLETVCLKCLSKEPRDRYSSAAHLADDLRRFRQGRPILARRASWRERAAKWARRNPALAAALVLSGALLFATTAVATGWGLHASRQAAAITHSLQVSEQLRAEGYVNTGLAEAGQGNVAAGLLWLARGLETAPEGALNLEWVARANLNAWSRELVALSDCGPGPPGEVLAFAPDGSSAWTVDPAGRDVQRWDLAKRELSGPLMRHPARVTALCASPNGALIATACMRTGEPVQIWDIRTGTVSRTLAHHGQVFGVAFFPDGESVLTATIASGLVSGSENRTVFQAWNLSSGRLAGESFEHPGWLRTMALSPDGATLYSIAAGGKTIRRWNMASGRFALPELPHPVSVTALAASGDGKHVLAGGSDRLARLIEVSSGLAVANLLHRNPVSAVAFDQAGRSIFTASPQDALRVWAARNRLDPPFAPHPAKVRALAVSPLGTQVATGCDDRIVRLWDLVDGALVKRAELPRHPSPIASVTFGPDGNLLATSTHMDTGASLWDLPSGKLRCTLAHPDRVHTVAFSSSGARVLTAAYGSTVYIWDAATGQEAAPPLDHGALVLAARFSPDDQTVVTAGEGGLVRRWNAATGAAQGAPWVHAVGPAVKVIAWSPDGEKLLTAGEDGVARQWDWLTGTPVGPPLDHGYQIWTACYSRDGRIILTGGTDNTAQLWHTTTGLRVGPPLEHSGRIWAADSSPAAPWAVTASEDGTARLWDLDTGRALGPPLDHDGEVLCAAVAENGRSLVTAGTDNTARIWAAPDRIQGPAKRFGLWAQVVCGAELDDSGGLRLLDAADWARRRGRLKELGGAPWE